MENEVNNNTPIEAKNNNSNNKPPKKSNIAKIIIIIVAVLVVAGGITFAAIKLSSSSKKKPETVSKEIDRVAVYNNAISSTFGKLNQLVDGVDSVQSKFQLGDKPLYFSGDIKLDSNIEELKSTGIDISKYKMDFGFGLDIKSQQIQLKAGLNDTLNAQIYYKNNKVYLVSDVLDNPVDITDEIESEISTSDFEDLSLALNEFNEIEKLEIDDELKTITEIFEQAITESIKEEKIESQESSYEVNGEKVEATKLTLTIDETTLKETIEKTIDKLENEEELISSLASIMGVSESDIKKLLEDVDTSDISLEEKIYISVYVPKNSEEAAGLIFKVDDKEFLTFYTHNGSLELTMTGNESQITLKTEKKDNGTNFSLKINSEELMKGTIREFSNKKIDFDVTITSEGRETALSIYLTFDQKESSIGGDYKLKMISDGQYIGVSGKYSLESKSSLENIDVSNAVSVDSVDSNKLVTNIQNKVASNADLKKLFELLFS